MIASPRLLPCLLVLFLVQLPARSAAQSLNPGGGSAPSAGGMSFGTGSGALGAGTAAEVAPKLSPESREFAELIYRTIAPNSTPTEIGNTAVSLWMIGRLQVALHLMGKAVADDPTDVDNQCNYAAMLTMSGGSKLAISALELLARKYPQNSTILNNLGQAYYLADDEEKAQQTLTRALAVAPGHPQAAATQSAIATAHGNTAQAVALAKQAVQRSLSRDKLNDLRKLRYKLTLDDMKSYRPSDPDPLGLKNFVHPEFPRDAVEQARMGKEWKAFYADLASRIQSLSQQRNALMAPMQAAAAAQAMAAFAQLQSGQMPSAPTKGGTTTQTAFGTITVEEKAPPVHPYAQRAQLMLSLLEKDSGAKYRLEQAKKALDACIAEGGRMIREEYTPAHDRLIRRDANQVGQGRPNEDLCGAFISLANTTLSKWSTDRATLFDAYLRELRLKLSEEIYWQQFVQPRDEFRLTLLNTQIEWLSAYYATGIGTDGTIRDDRAMVPVEVDPSCPLERPAPRKIRLANFNDTHCQYHSELNLPLGSIVTDCEKMVSSLGVGPVKLGLTQDMDQGTDFVDSFVSCNVEVSAGKSAKVDVGPLSVEVGAEAGLGVEIGRNGIQDVYVTGKVEASAGPASSSIEGRVSVMDGTASASTDVGLTASASSDVKVGGVDVEVGASAGVSGHADSDGSRSTSATVKAGASVDDAGGVGAEGSVTNATASDGSSESYATGKVSGSAADTFEAGAEMRMSLMSGGESAGIL